VPVTSSVSVVVTVNCCCVLSGTPVVSLYGGNEREKRREQRLIRLQSARATWGDLARGPSWEAFLGAALVARLGGFETVRRDAPVFEVQPLPGDGAYLRLTEQPAVIESPDYEQAATRLHRYLTPILPPQLALEPERGA
jgi:hypothetical protein